MFKIRAARVIERLKQSKVQSENKESEHSALCILHSAFFQPAVTGLSC
ncbi:MAG: hypothetical protein FWH27_01240 [Planctomycetaceae bacterium]|nr:hypothetical protein [Planctomycetaceae bacterium]